MITLIKYVKYIVIFFSILSFYFFSRLTVDDAFISWRYGRNFIEHGIWNYNPSSFDLTEAFTNPIMAYLSIVPNYLGINIVLFFKLFAIIVTLLFVYFITEKFKKKNINILIFFAMPGVVFHFFGGLETVLFAIFGCMLLISLYKDNLLNSIFFTILLFLTRPESLTLLFLIPIYFLLNFNDQKIYNDKNFNPFSFINIEKSNLKNFLISLFCLGIFLFITFNFSYNYFGYLFPNTYYIKSSGFFKPSQLMFYSFFIFPSLYLIYIKKLKLFLFIVLFFMPIAYVYSKSNLSMNYHGRFLFHFYGPIILFIIYLSHQTKKIIYLELERYTKKLKFDENFLLNIFIWPFFLVFLYVSSFEFRYTTTYYPRLLDAHGKLGSVINENKQKYKINSISIGDAGLLPYNANVNTLDLGALGSSIATHNGWNNEVIDLYDPKIIILRVNPETDEIYENKVQNLMINWIKKNNYIEICDVIFHQQYFMRVYAPMLINEISNVCSSSKVNDFTNHQYILKNIYLPPWKFWK